MAEHSSIEWTDATWNPITGCSVVSPGCTNCYAMRLAGTRLKHHPSRAGLTRATKAGPVWTGKVRFNEQWLTEPLSWRKPRMIFVCAHGDLFHEDVPDAWIDRVFAVMALAPQHTFQVLTKRAERMRRYFETIAAEVAARGEEGYAPRRFDGIACDVSKSPCAAGFIEDQPWPLRNVWIGVSAEDQKRADERIPHLLATPAAVRFVSAEPLLGPIDLTALDISGDAEMDALKPRSWLEEIELWRGTSDTWEEDFLDWFGISRMPSDGYMSATLDWIIVGGESQAGARPMHPDWARSIRDQCAAAGVPMFFKQWGEYLPLSDVDRIVPPAPGDTMGARFDVHHMADYLPMARVGKKAGGRLLDGVEHNGMPAAALRASTP